MYPVHACSPGVHKLPDLRLGLSSSQSSVSLSVAADSTGEPSIDLSSTVSSSLQSGSWQPRWFRTVTDRSVGEDDGTDSCKWPLHVPSLINWEVTTTTSWTNRIFGVQLIPLDSHIVLLQTQITEIKQWRLFLAFLQLQRHKHNVSCRSEYCPREFCLSAWILSAPLLSPPASEYCLVSLSEWCPPVNLFYSGQS